MPLPLPITHNVRGAVIDALSFSDLAKEAALGRVVDFELVDGGVPHLVLVEEAGVFGQGGLVSLILEDVVLMTLGGPVVPGPPRLSIVDRLHVLTPALQAGAGICGPRPGVGGPPGSPRSLALTQIDRDIHRKFHVPAFMEEYEMLKLSQ